MADTTCPICAAALRGAPDTCPACLQPLTFLCPRCNEPVPLSVDRFCPACEAPVELQRDESRRLGRVRWQLKLGQEGENPEQRIASFQTALDAADEVLNDNADQEDALRLRTVALRGMLDTLVERSDAHRQAGHGIAALADLRRWLALNPDDVMMQLRLSELEAHRQQFLDEMERARGSGEFDRFLELAAAGRKEFADDPTFQERIDSLTVFRQAQEKALCALRELEAAKQYYHLKEALDEMKEAVAGHPDALAIRKRTEVAVAAAEERMARARARLAENDFAQAQSYAKTALTLAADQPEAADVARRAEQQEVDARAALQQTRALLAEGRTSAAREAVERASAQGLPSREWGALEREIEEAVFRKRRRWAVRTAVGAAAALVVAGLLFAARFGLAWWQEGREFRVATRDAERSLSAVDPDAAFRAMDRFLSRYPNTRFKDRLELLRARAAAAYDERAYRDLLLDLTLTADPAKHLAGLDRYLAEHPAGAYREVVAASRAQTLARVERLAYEDLQRRVRELGERFEETAALYDAFLLEHGGGRFGDTVRAQREAVPDKIAERDFNALVARAKASSLESAVVLYRDYLFRFPRSPYAAEVQQLREDAREQLAQRELERTLARIEQAGDDKDQILEECRRYLDRFSDSGVAERIRGILEQLPLEQEAAAYARLQKEVAEAAGNVPAMLAACDRFLVTFPRGRFAEDARDIKRRATRAREERRFEQFLVDVAAAPTDGDVIRLVEQFLETDPTPENRAAAAEIHSQALERIDDGRLEELMQFLAAPNVSSEEAMALCQRYLETYPDSVHATVVRERQETIRARYEEALYRGVREAARAARIDDETLIQRCDAYLQFAPSGAHAEEVRDLRYNVLVRQRERDLAALNDELEQLEAKDYLERSKRLAVYLERHGDDAEADRLRARYQKEMDQGYRHYLERAHEAMAKSEHTAALGFLTRALQLQPGRPEALELYDRIVAEPTPTPRDFTAEPRPYLKVLRDSGD